MRDYRSVVMHYYTTLMKQFYRCHQVDRHVLKPTVRMTSVVTTVWTVAAVVCNSTSRQYKSVSAVHRYLTNTLFGTLTD